jgi:hypothetical protein
LAFLEKHSGKQGVRAETMADLETRWGEFHLPNDNSICMARSRPYMAADAPRPFMAPNAPRRMMETCSTNI